MNYTSWNLGRDLGSCWYLPGPAGTWSSTWWRTRWTRPRTLKTARGTRLSRSPSVSLRWTFLLDIYLFCLVQLNRSLKKSPCPNFFVFGTSCHCIERGIILLYQKSALMKLPAGADVTHPQQAQDQAVELAGHCSLDRRGSWRFRSLGDLRWWRRSSLIDLYSGNQGGS